jgi:signal peptidase II
VKTRFLLILIALPLILIDRLTKVWAESNLQLGRPEEVVGTLLQFNLVYNPGAAFSILTDATWVFTIFALCFSTFILLFAQRITTLPWKIAAGLGLGGAVGNLIDRIVNGPAIGQGPVIDFIMVPYWPIFNIADASMSIAVVIIVIASLRGVDYK